MNRRGTEDAESFKEQSFLCDLCASAVKYFHCYVFKDVVVLFVYKDLLIVSLNISLLIDEDAYKML